MVSIPAPCPTCRKPVERDTAFVPFCSARCKMVDLGRWFRGDYVVAGEDAIAIDPEELEEHLRHLEEQRPRWTDGSGADDDTESDG